MKRTLRILTALLKRVELPWTGSANIPFYVVVQKPRPSMSKHDDRPVFWNYDDGEYLYACVNWVPFILDYVRRLRRVVAAAKRLHKENRWGGSCRCGMCAALEKFDNGK